MTKTSKRVHRLCPCDPCDVEGIQSWLEDLAAQGLFLIKDGVFCGVFTFERRAPQTVAYRLDVAQKQKPRFPESGDELTEEEVELYRAMGWEHLLRYGDFRIYRSAADDVPELHTEGETHAITVGLLKKKYRSAFINAALTAVFFLLCSQSALRYNFRIAAAIGLFFLICIYGAILDAWLTQLVRLFRFRRYEKRLLCGEALNRRTEWRKTAPFVYCIRLLPLLFAFGVACSLSAALSRESAVFPHAEYPGDPPFATAEDIFTDSTVSADNEWLDYGTFKTGKTAVAENVEWNESCDVITADGSTYFCILRLNYHETVSEWFARGLERDYYVYDATRYRGKNFEDIPAPELGVDSICVYNNYGSLCVLMRQGSRVVHAVVTVSGGDDAPNEWHLWAQAMAEMLQ